MKIAVILIAGVLLFSCNTEKKITRKIIKYDKKLDEAAYYFINKYNKETLLTNTQIEDRKIAHFLKSKMRTPFVHITYGTAKYFMITDSVIFFTKAGFSILGNEHDILIDFKKIPRDSFSHSPFEILKKVSERKYYGKAPMPAF